MLLKRAAVFIKAGIVLDVDTQPQANGNGVVLYPCPRALSLFTYAALNVNTVFRKLQTMG